MFPVSTSRNVPDGNSGYPVVFGKPVVNTTERRFKGSFDFDDIGCCELRTVDILSFVYLPVLQLFPLRLPALRDAIRGVVLSRTNKKVGRVQASRVITTVADMEVWRHSNSSCQLDHESVRPHRPTIDADNWIRTDTSARRNPRPAFVRATALDVLPDALDREGFSFHGYKCNHVGMGTQTEGVA